MQLARVAARSPVSATAPRPAFRRLVTILSTTRRIRAAGISSIELAAWQLTPES